MPDVFSAGSTAFNVSDYDIEERCGQHDLLTVTGTVKTLAAEIGKPALLQIDQGAYSRKIVGYVDTQATSMGRDRETFDAVYMLGASSVMRSGVERKWKGKRPFDIASEIVRPYGFCLEMDTYKYTIPLFAQSAESDWQLLNRLAAEIGMALIGTNTVIRMVDPILEIRRRKLRPLNIIDIRTLSDYNISQSPVPLGYEGRVFQGVDRFRKSFVVTANPDSSVVLPAPETVRSLEDALSAAERIERRRHRLKRATCSMKFMPILRSGTTLALTNGTDTNVWFITESRHVSVANDKVRTYLVLNRDEDDDRTAVDAWRGSQWPEPVLMGDRWVSSIRWEREL
jgi:hypothetical protein